MELFDESTYKPENARGIAQKVLVGVSLLQMKRIKEFRDDGGALPPTILTYVQGNPGTGNTYISRMGGMGFDQATAPTGTAAKLLKGKTDTRAFSFPVGKKIKAAPGQFPGISITAIKAHLMQWRKVVALLKDEHSMDCREK
jgi:hypothetical protein